MSIHLGTLIKDLYHDFLSRKKAEDALSEPYLNTVSKSLDDFKALKSKEVLLGLYQNAINEFDDYFEYTNESKKDRAKVREILGELTTNIAEHMDVKKEQGWITLEEFNKDPTVFCEIEYKGSIKECVCFNHTFYSIYTSVIFMDECVGKVRKGVI